MEDCVIRENYETGRIHVLQAPDRIRVSDGLYRMMESGEGHPDAHAGEGLLMFTADNGTFRYRLTEPCTSGGMGDSWHAERIYP